MLSSKEKETHDNSKNKINFLHSLLQKVLKQFLTSFTEIIFNSRYSDCWICNIHYLIFWEYSSMMLLGKKLNIYLHNIN